MNVYFVRHGESDANAGGAYQGQNTPLSNKGAEQAEKAAERFTRIPVDVVVTSEFPRAIKTGEAIAKKSGAIIEKPVKFFGEREHPPEALGLLTNSPEYKHIRKEAWRLFEDNKRYSTEENFDDLCTRADIAISFLENKKEDNIVVVSHGNFLRFLVSRMCYGESLTPKIFIKFMHFARVSNTGITHLELTRENNWLMYQWNDHAHLG